MPARHLAIVAAFLIAGCALHRRPALRPTTAAELLDALAARRAAIGSLRARARLRSGVSALWVHEAVVVRRPDAVRIDVLSPFGLALAVGVVAGELWAYPPAQATRYQGPATPATLGRFLGTPIAVPDVVDVLLGVPPARAPVGPPVLSTTRDGEYRLAVPLAHGVQTIWFAGDTLVVRRAEETEDGRLVLGVVFDDYRDGFPHVLDVAALPGPAARLTYDAVETNAPLDAGVFTPPPASRVLPLEAAPAPERS
jgi:hypothetical protein